MNRFIANVFAACLSFVHITVLSFLCYVVFLYYFGNWRQHHEPFEDFVYRKSDELVYNPGAQPGIQPGAHWDFFALKIAAIFILYVLLMGTITTVWSFPNELHRSACRIRVFRRFFVVSI